MTDLFNRIEASASISDCGRYRYSLTRRWSDGPTCSYIMLNPSTADGTADDPTIRRCIGFARREGCGGMIVVNLFAYRATKPSDLWAATPDDRTGGPEAELAFFEAMSASTLRIAAWGAATRGAEHWIVERFGSDLKCLGKTKNGQPRHPLYVRGDAPLVPLMVGRGPDA